jgi:hypothetical protein
VRHYDGVFSSYRSQVEETVMNKAIQYLNEVALSLAAKNLIRYLDNKDYQEEMDARAATATDGNITALEVLIHELHEALKPYPDTISAEVR